MNKIGLVLSGGGARGFAHLGLLKVLDELQIKVAAISGVSAGAIFGALYASGKKPDEILDIALTKNGSYFGFSSVLWRKEGIFSLEAVRKILLENIPEDSFESLQIPLFINATDFLHSKTLFFSKGNLISRIIASASVPVVFQPVIEGGSKLVDGGLLNNFPVEPLLGICDKIIGSHVNKLEDISDIHFRFSKAAMIERTYHIAVANSVYSRAPQCDVFIEAALDKFGLVNIRNAAKIFDIGYHTALKYKRELADLLQ
ncbi:MAG: patatin-like phospholipase family protein [Ginsengibacter sp.]